MALLGLIAGCQGTLTSDGRPGVPADLDVVRTFDRDGDLEAVGVRPPDLGDEPVAAGSDGQVALPLAVVDTTTRTASRPLGERRVLDAALVPGGTGVAFLDAGGRPCLAMGGAEPTCADQPGLPMGLDALPDGRIVFVAETPAGTNLWLIDPRLDAGPRRLTTGFGIRDRPVADPAGEQVAFVASSSAGLASLFVVDVDGGEPRQLTNVGLTRTPGAPLPVDLVPVPLARASMHWDAGGLRYESSEAVWRIDPVTGAAEREEGVL